MAEKWNGKSVYQLNQKKQRIAALNAAIGELARIRSEAEQAYLDELGRIIERNPRTLETGSWPCDTSPTGLCVYDMATEEQDNECLFCGNPNERK
jgi:hypothetical protein